MTTEEKQQVILAFLKWAEEKHGCELWDPDPWSAVGMSPYMDRQAGCLEALVKKFVIEESE